MEDPDRITGAPATNGASADGDGAAVISPIHSADSVDSPESAGDQNGAEGSRHGRVDLREAYRRHCADPARERAFLSATSFTVAFATCRIVTHAIRAQVGPFRNMSVGGRHLHHSTFGIFGLIAVGEVWTYRIAIGHPGSSNGSRAAATAYGVFTALTLDEFALWFDLQDDYWNAAGRKSIDAVAVFGGLSAMTLAGRGLLRECGRAARHVLRDLRGA